MSPLNSAVHWLRSSWHRVAAGMELVAVGILASRTIPYVSQAHAIVGVRSFLPGGPMPGFLGLATAIWCTAILAGVVIYIRPAPKEWKESSVALALLALCATSAWQAFLLVKYWLAYPPGASGPAL